MTKTKSEGRTARLAGSSSAWRIAPSGGWSNAPERAGARPENPTELPTSLVLPVIDVELDDLDPGLDGRTTVLFLRAVSGTVEEPDVEFPRSDLDGRAERLLSDAVLSADEAARFEHRRRVIAPLFMLLALGLLVGAGWSC